MEWVISIASLGLNVITVLVNYFVSRDKNKHELKVMQVEQSTGFKKARWDNAMADAETLIKDASIGSIQKILNDVHGLAFTEYETEEEDFNAKVEGFRIIDEACTNLRALSFKLGIAINMLGLDSPDSKESFDIVNDYIDDVIDLLTGVEKVYDTYEPQKLIDYYDDINNTDLASYRESNKIFRNHIMNCMSRYSM